LIQSRNEYLSITGIEVFAVSRGERWTGRSRGGGLVKVNRWTDV
jgi:hypothetical protein